MRTPRIFHPSPIRVGEEIELDGNAARHVGKVLRLSAEAAITLFDGRGGEYRASLRCVEKRRVTADVLEFLPREVESPLSITLAQGISKGDRMDFTIQKAVELGISRIVPLNTERSVVNLKGERMEKKLSHWRGVIISACEQCGRNTLPELLPPSSLQQWLQVDDANTHLLLDHRAGTTLGSLATSNAMTLLIGPEGGLSETEREQAYASGYQGLSLGPRVLRTETAALTALAALQSRFGDLG